MPEWRGAPTLPGMIIDALQFTRPSRRIFEQMRDGGVRAVHMTVSYHEGFRDTAAVLGRWNRQFEAHGDLILRGTGDPILVTAAREARAKLQAGLPSPEERTLTDAPYFSLNDQTGASPDISAIRDAIRTRRIVRMVYKDAGDTHSARRVHPLVIWSLTDGWMFSAWCTLRQDFRTFRFDRIQSLEVTEEIFTDNPETGLQTFLDREACAAH